MPGEIVLNRQGLFARTSAAIGKRDRARAHMKKAEAPLPAHMMESFAALGFDANRRDARRLDP